MQAKTRDMTTGNPLWLILSFALPLMAGNMCQQLYTMTDTAIVGKFIGIDALAALGASDWLNWLVLGIVSGFAQGFSLLVAQRFGAGDYDGVRSAVGASAVLAAVMALALTALGLAFARPALIAMDTPENILNDSYVYLSILYGGIPIIMTYNLLSSVLRALGNGRAPLYAMLVASATNIALDLLFILAFHWGVAGAAIATVIGQMVSCVYCLLVMRKMPVLRLKRADFHVDWTLGKRLLRLGVPMALQNMVIGVGGIILQRVINGFGIVLVAGFVATNKLYGLIELAAVSYGYAVSTYVGQNHGARKNDRIKKGMRASVSASVLTAVGIGALMLIFGRNILSLFIDGAAENAAQVMDVAFRYLSIMSVCLPILYLLHNYRSVLQGMGDTFVPMLSGVAELAMRVSCALILPMFIGIDGIFVAEVAAWTGAALLLIAAYYARARNLSL